RNTYVLTILGLSLSRKGWFEANVGDIVGSLNLMKESADVWKLDDMNSALAAAMSSLEIAKHWAQLDGNNSEALNRTAGAFTIVGNAERRLNRLKEAQEAISSGIAIRRKLDPNNSVYMADLAVSWLRLSDVLWEQGDYPGVLQAGQHAIGLLK